MTTQTKADRRAKATAISIELAKLAPQYYRPDFGPAQAEQLFAAFEEDLTDFAVCDIEQAMREYRRNAANKFFPTSGQIRELATKAAKDRADMSRPRAPLPESRPNMWWLLCVWRPHWREDEIPLEHIRAFEERKRWAEPPIIMAGGDDRIAPPTRRRAQMRDAMAQLGKRA